MEYWEGTEDQQENQRLDKEHLKLRRANWRAALKDGAAQYVLFDILRECGIYEVGFSGNAENLIFREGKRTVGAFIKETMENIDPTSYNRIMEKHK